MTRPLVSVVITSYNYAHFIRDAVDSVLTQDYPNVEIVVTDNQSTDDTLEILEASYGGDPRVRINVNDANIGIAANANVALRLARGAFVVVLSADDFLLPGHISRLVALAEAHPEFAVVYGGAVFANAAGKPEQVRMLQAQVPGSYLGGRNEFPWLMLACYVCLPSVLFRRETLERYGLFDEEMQVAADWEITSRLAAAGEQFGYVSTPVAAVRIHPGQRSTFGYIESGGELRESLDILERYLTPENAHLYHGHEISIKVALAARVGRLTRANPANYTPELKDRVETMEGKLLSEHLVRKLRGLTPKVGVVVLSRGRIALLHDALQSLLAQTHKNWEAVVVQTAGTPIDSLVAMHGQAGKIRHVRLDSAFRPSAARNLGLNLVDGDYRIFLDEDDEFLPDHMASLVDAARADGVRAAVAGTTICFDEYSERIGMVRTEIGRSADLRLLAPKRNDLEVANCVPLGAMLFEATLVDQLQFFQDGYGALADWDFVWRAAKLERFAPTGARTFIEHAALRLHGQFLALGLRTYLASLNALYAANPAADAGVRMRRQAYREQLERLVTVAPRTLDKAERVGELYAALAGKMVAAPA